MAFWLPKVGSKPDNLKRIAKAKNAKNKDKLDIDQELADIRARFAFEEQVIDSLPQEVIKEISKLFSKRDSAVSEGDRRKFIETQLNEEEIPHGSSRGYVSIQELKTSILRISSVNLELRKNIHID